MNATAVSEFDVLEWIEKLATTEATVRNNAREHLRDAGADALPWLVCAYNGSRERNAEITALVREIVSKNGIPSRGRKAIRRILETIA